MHEAALSRAAQPAPAVVLEMALRPLSVGHVLQFSRDGITEGIVSGKLDSDQVTNAVLICCQTWKQSSSIERDPLLSLKLWFWRRRVLRAATRHALKGGGGFYFEGETRKFKQYLRDGSLEFELSDFVQNEPSQRSRSPGAPWLLRLQQWLMTTLRLTECEAWDYPFGLAKMRWACHWEQEGGLNIKNDQEMQFDSYVEEQESKEALN